MPIAPIIHLAPRLALRQAAREAAADVTDPEVSALLDDLRADWAAAKASAPDAETTRLWWASELVARIAGAEDPASLATGIAAELGAEVSRRLVAAAERGR